MITDRMGVLDLEATGGVGGLNVEHHGVPTPLLPLERQILQEAEVVTPPRREALQTLAVKAFGDMGQIRDHFIAGHISCELRRYLESVPPKTPIQDVVDRCRVWESHADPEIRWVSKPSIYPAYIVGDSDHVGETLQVMAVTKPKSPPD